MTKQSFITGAMILLSAGIITRLLGFVPRIILPRLIGAEGVGLYQLGYPFLSVVLTLITGGIPLAIAKMVAEAETVNNQRKVKSILVVSILFVLSISSLFTIICLWAAPWITTHLFTDSRVYLTFLSMSPMFIIIGISSVLKGYFQGKHNMIPTAVSQIVETLTRIVAVLFLAQLFLPLGVHYAAAGAMLGVTIGEFFSFFLLFYHYRKSKKTEQLNTTVENKAYFRHLKDLLQISIPVTASQLVRSGSGFLESIMTVQSLAIAGIAAATATAQYGQLMGMVLPIIYFPTALTASLAISLIPSLSEAAARQDFRTIHKRLHQSLRLALVVGAPFAMITFVLAEPLSYYLYRSSEIGLMLKMMAPISIFLYFQAPLQATLQALEKPGIALRNVFIGVSIKLVLITLLASKPEFGIYGVLIASGLSISLITTLHWISVVRFLRFKMKLSDFLKTMFAVCCAGSFAYYCMANHFTVLLLARFMIAMFGSIVIYLAIAWTLKIIQKKDLERIPWIQKYLK